VIGEYDPNYSADNGWNGGYKGGDIVTFGGCEFEAKYDTIQPPAKFYVSDWIRSNCCVVDCSDAPEFGDFDAPEFESV